MQVAFRNELVELFLDLLPLTHLLLLIPRSNVSSRGPSADLPTQLLRHFFLERCCAMKVFFRNKLVEVFLELLPETHFFLLGPRSNGSARGPISDLRTILLRNLLLE